MNELRIFENVDFGQVRTIEIDNKPYFCGKDVASALGYTIPSKAINTHCKGVSKMEVPTNGGKQEMLFISEGDLYRLITHSKLPQAEKFESWIFDEVLPTIRRHGMYATEELLDNPDIAIAAFTALKEEREKRKLLEAKVAEDNPKVLFADAVNTSKTSILVGDLAKILNQNGVDIGGTRLFKWLRNNGYLIKRKGTDYNSPTQKSMELGLFEVKETAITHSDGHVSVNKTPKVTGKGQVYFINKLLKDKVANILNDDRKRGERIWFF